jgi:hypothetical protein
MGAEVPCPDALRHPRAIRPDLIEWLTPDTAGTSYPNPWDAAICRTHFAPEICCACDAHRNLQLFTEGFDTADLKDAKTLLDELKS